MEKQRRNTVISVRLDDLSIQAIDLLVEAGLFQSRSEAASQFIKVGIQSSEDLLKKAREIADHVQQMKQDFMDAVKTNNAEKVQTLLDRNKSLAGSEDNGDTPILMSVYYGAKEVKDMLLSKKTELTFFEASAVGDLQAVENYLGGDPELIHTYSHDGWTALHLASFFGHKDTAELLLENKAAPSAVSTNEMKNTPLHAALAGKHSDVAQILITSGADILKTDNAGWTPLHHASANGDIEIIKSLIDNCADIDVLNKQKQTPLDLAKENGQTDAIDLLKSTVRRK